MSEKIEDAGMDALGKFLDGLKGAMHVIHSLGFNISGMRLETGVPPGISTKLVGAVENINVGKSKTSAKSTQTTA